MTKPNSPGHRHIAVVPARKGSKGVPGKNRALFGLLADFIDASGLFDATILTTDDEDLIARAAARGYLARRRPDALASDSASIKQAFVDLAAHPPMPLAPHDYLWLLFIPLVWREIGDFRDARAIVDARRPAGLCSFIPVKNHPYSAWRIDAGAGRIEKYIDNDYYNRQDFPPAWENYNHLSCVRVADLPRANANLVCSDTWPVLLDHEYADKLVEIDEPEDFRRWRAKHPALYAAWRAGLSDEERRAMPLPAE